MADYSSESVLVVGAGLAGCFLAYELRRLGYGQVILTERLDEVCGVGPKVVTEIHAGGEYPFDRQSAVDCLHGLAVLQRILPSKVLNKPRSHLLVSEGSAKAGLNGEKYAAHLIALQREYENMVREDPALEEDICAVTDFWRRLDPEEYCEVINVDSGFETPQRGIQPDILASTMFDMLKSSQVDVRLSQEAVGVARRADGSFQVTVITSTNESTVECSQIAFANHVLGFKMMTALADDGFSLPSIYFALRMIVAVEHGVDRTFPAPTRLMLEGDYGAMDAPLDRRRSLGYHPPHGQSQRRQLQAPGADE